MTKRNFEDTFDIQWCIYDRQLKLILILSVTNFNTACRLLTVRQNNFQKASNHLIHIS